MGKLVNKYFVGEALCQVPFFTLSHLYAKLFDEETNGYSKPYQYGVGIAAVFYFLLGLFFLWKFLKSFEFRIGVILFVCVCVAFGTNLFYYAVYEPSMAHVYSFSFITGFLFFTRSFLLSPSGKGIIIIAAFTGMITLIRPVDIMIVFAFPFLAGNFENLKNAMGWMKKHLLFLVPALALFLLIVSLQLLLYYWQTGHFFLWSYQSEGFDFAHPHIYRTLFSYEKGLFIYTPIAFVSLFGLLVMPFRSRYLFLTLLPVLGIIVFVVSSWHDWRYGFSFGLRAYIEFYALSAFTLAYLIDFASKRRIIFAFTGLIFSALISFYLIQQYQFNHRILHPGSMNKERYYLVFLHTEKKYEDTLSRIPYVMESEGDFNDMEGSVDWPGLETIKKGLSHSGEAASRIDSASPYSAGFCRSMSDDDFNTPSTIKISAWVLRKNENDNGSIGIYLTSNDSVLFSKDIDLNELTKTGAWTNVKQEIIIPARKTEREYLRVLFFHSSGTTYIDDFSVEIVK